MPTDAVDLSQEILRAVEAAWALALDESSVLPLDGGEESASFRVDDFVIRIGPEWRTDGDAEWCYSVAVPVLGGAALTDGACRSIALYEPALPVSRPVIHDDAYASFCAAVAEDRQIDAFWIVVDDVLVPTTDEERALLSLSGAADLLAPGFPLGVRNFLDMNRPIDTAVLEQLVMPVLLLNGTRSSDHYKDAVRFLSETLHDARVIQVDGAGHLGPTTHAQAVAEKLVAFFTA